VALWRNAAQRDGNCFLEEPCGSLFFSRENTYYFFALFLFSF
jgi:hypothetical protein